MAKLRTRRMQIPTIGEVLTLAEDWVFPVLAEWRNDGLMNYMVEAGVLPPDPPRFYDLPTCGVSCRHRFWTDESQEQPCSLASGHDGDHNPVGYGNTRRFMTYEVTVPRGVQLRVDRIYIRKGAPDYDSLTFWAQNLAGTRHKVRFFAKLRDVNRMVVLEAGEVAPPRAKAEAPRLRAILLRE